MTLPYRFLAILFILSVLIFFLDQQGAFSAAASSVSRGVIGPISRAGSKLLEKTAGAFQPLFLFRPWLNDYRKVSTERDFYRGEYFRLLTVQAENEFLRQALNLSAQKPAQLILAEVIAFNPLQPTNEITLNKGRRDGIKEGLAVIIPGRVLVGLISTVGESTSRVALVTSEQSRITATISGREAAAIVAGSPTGALRLELVPKDIELKEGEIVLSSGLAGSIPPNLLLGEVRRVNKDESASFQEAVLEPFFKGLDLRQVFIVKEDK